VSGPGIGTAQRPIVVVAAVIEQNDTFLVTERGPGTHLEGCWEFPGGKCEPTESHLACLGREIREELGTEARVGEKLFETTHAYEDRTVELHFYRCQLLGTPKPLLGQAIRWVPRAALGQLPFPPADRELIRRLRED
jgi:8-oxo-dGTP diphosphatase